MSPDRHHPIMERMGVRVATIAAASVGVIVVGGYLAHELGHVNIDIHGPHFNPDTPPKGTSKVDTETETVTVNEKALCPATVDVDDGSTVGSTYFVIGGYRVDQAYSITMPVCQNPGIPLAVHEHKNAVTGKLLSVTASETNYYPQGASVDLFSALGCLTVPNGASLGEIDSKIKEYNKDEKHGQVAHCSYNSGTTFLGFHGWIGNHLGGADNNEVVADTNESIEIAEAGAQITPLTRKAEAQIEAKGYQVSEQLLKQQFPGVPVLIEKGSAPSLGSVKKQIEDNWANAPEDMKKSFIVKKFERQGKNFVLYTKSVQNGAEGTINLGKSSEVTDGDIAALNADVNPPKHPKVKHSTTANTKVALKS